MTTVTDLSDWDKDPRLFLFTSLTAGSSHIVTATSRIETILRANRLPFQAVDTATDEKARKLWGRRAGKKKLPGLVKEGYVIADLDEIEEWNEFGELRENIGPLPPATGGATSVNTVQSSLGNLRMHDAVSQTAKPPTAPPAAPKAKTPLVDASSDGPKRIATPLVNIMAAKASPASATSAASTTAKPEAATSSTEEKKQSNETAEQAKPDAVAAVPDDTKTAVEAEKEAKPDTTTTSVAEDTKASAVPAGGSKPETIDASAAQGEKDSTEPVQEPKPVVVDDTKDSAETAKETTPEVVPSTDAPKGTAETAKEAPAPSTPTPAEPAVDSTIAAVSSADTAELSPPQGAADEKKHRGSSVSAASPDAIKEVEQKIAIPEEDGEETAAA